MKTLLIMIFLLFHSSEAGLRDNMKKKSIELMERTVKSMQDFSEQKLEKLHKKYSQDAIRYRSLLDKSDPKLIRERVKLGKNLDYYKRNLNYSINYKYRDEELRKKDQERLDRINTLMQEVIKL